VHKYDFRCKDCHHSFTVTIDSYQKVDQVDVQCPKCQSKDLSRLIRRVAIMASEDQHLERMSDMSRFGGFDEDDPRSMGRFMREMATEMGEPLDPEMGEVLDRLESGENPESVEQSMGLSDSLGADGAVDLP